LPKINSSVLLMLDFDGTLALIPKYPKHARLSIKTRSLLEKLIKKFHVAIITGRPLKNIKGKIGIKKGIIYSGVHGYEWQIGKKEESVKVSKIFLDSLKNAREQFELLLPEYSCLSVDDKKSCIAVFYRGLKNTELKSFLFKAYRIIEKLDKKKLEIIFESQSFELRPRLNWTKGHFAKFAIKKIQSKIKQNILPIYIGDGLTDEDAFKALKKNGITIRVGKSNKSAAQYYLKNQKQVDKFLEWLTDRKV